MDPNDAEIQGSSSGFQWVRGDLISQGLYWKMHVALNTTTGDMIAVKQVEVPEIDNDTKTRQQNAVKALEKESTILKGLDHPNIVQYLGFAVTPSPTTMNLFLEYVPGGSIETLLIDYGRLEDRLTISFTSDILNGLVYLHSKGIIHLNLNSTNVLVGSEGECKISDFSTAEFTQDGGVSTSPVNTMLFSMAPELLTIREKGYTSKVDIWSLGCTVLEMWTGEGPWAQEEAVAVMFKLSQRIPPPAPKDLILSDLADDFRKKCFIIEPDERPTASELRSHPYLTYPVPNA